MKVFTVRLFLCIGFVPYCCCRIKCLSHVPQGGGSRRKVVVAVVVPVPVVTAAVEYLILPLKTVK